MQSRPRRKAAGHRYFVADDDDANDDVDWVPSRSVVSLPKRRKAARRPVVADSDDAPKRSGSVVWGCDPSHIETMESQDDDNSWEVTTPLAKNGMTFVRYPHYVESAMTRPTPAHSPTLVPRTSWHIRLTKVSIALTVLSAAAMLGQDLVQIFAVITLFLGFLFTMGSI